MLFIKMATKMLQRFTNREASEASNIDSAVTMPTCFRMPKVKGCPRFRLISLRITLTNMFDRELEFGTRATAAGIDSRWRMEFNCCRLYLSFSTAMDCNS